MDNKKEKINKLLTRGVEAIYPSPDFLKDRLLKREKMVIYMGIDPTGPSIHLGHASILLKLKEFADLGHKVIILIGDFTAMIGDPDKITTRKKLSRQEVLENCKNYKKQIKQIFGNTPFGMVYNSKWFSKMKMSDVLDLTSEFTVSQMMERDMFSERSKVGLPVYINELLYPMMQGYDSTQINCDVEIGGNDQTFNMMVGRQLSKRFLNKEKIVIALKLLVDPKGKKMGKTEGNMIRLDDKPSDMYGQIMSWPDELISPAFEICLDLEQSEVDKILKKDPLESKMILAKLITAMLSGDKKAELAENDFINKFQKKTKPLEMPVVKAQKGDDLKEILLSLGCIKSKSEFKRLITGGGVSFNDQKIKDLNYLLKENGILKIGKKNFFEIKLKN